MQVECEKLKAKLRPDGGKYVIKDSKRCFKHAFVGRV